MPHFVICVAFFGCSSLLGGNNYVYAHACYVILSLTVFRKNFQRFLSPIVFSAVICYPELGLSSLLSSLARPSPLSYAQVELATSTTYP